MKWSWLIDCKGFHIHADPHFGTCLASLNSLQSQVVNCFFIGVIIGSKEAPEWGEGCKRIYNDIYPKTPSKP